MNHDPFGELRSLLQRPPGPDRWDALVTLLESWPDPDDLTQRAVPYALDIIRKQPGPRPAPLTWLGAIYDDPTESAPLLPLADSLTWDPYDGLEDDAFAQTLLAQHDLRGVRALSLSRVPCSEDTLTALGSTLGPRLEHLALWGCVTRDVDHAALFASTSFPDLESLDLGANTLSASAWAREDLLPALSRLRVSTSYLDHRACEAMSRAPLLGHLSALDIRHTQLAGAPLREVIDALPKTLESLLIGGCPLETADLLAVGDASFAPGLEFLDLGEAAHLEESDAFSFMDPLSDTTEREAIDYAAFVASSERLTSLRRLDLHQNAPSQELLPLLVRAEHLRSVRELDISINSLGNDGVDALLHTPLLDGVHALDLSFNDTTPYLAEILRRAPALESLRVLKLRGNDLSGAGLGRLSLASFFPRLEHLDLYQCGLEPRTLESVLDGLSSSNRLRVLDLSGNALDDQAARALVDADLRALESLQLDRRPLSPQARASLRSRYPFVNFVY